MQDSQLYLAMTSNALITLNIQQYQVSLTQGPALLLLHAYRRRPVPRLRLWLRHVRSRRERQRRLVQLLLRQHARSR
jgi:hypothetical protein